MHIKKKNPAVFPEAADTFSGAKQTIVSEEFKKFELKVT